jgi:CfrBI restriction endonuclease
MSITLSDTVIKKVIKKLIKGEDYRIEILTLINAEFLQDSIDFFKKVVDAKINNQSITVDWYKQEFLNDKLPSDEITINSGLNKKTIANMYNSARREIVLDASIKHYEQLAETINILIEEGEGIDINLIIKFRGVSIDLNINETLIIINRLAVKRAALRGGLWSTAGKSIEKKLMITLCHLFNIDEKYYHLNSLPESLREVDFYLINSQGDYKKIEVKLMGKGNPESADAVMARESDIFIADKLSDLNKKQLDDLGIYWVELRSENGYKKFLHIAQSLSIPCTNFNNNLDTKIDEIFTKIF